MTRVVFYAVAKTYLPKHFHIVFGAHSYPLGFQQQVLLSNQATRSSSSFRSLCKQRRPFPWCWRIGWPDRRDNFRVRRWSSRKLRQSPVCPRFHPPEFDPYGIVRIGGKQVHDAPLPERPAFSSTRSYCKDPRSISPEECLVPYQRLFRFPPIEPGSHPVSPIRKCKIRWQ